ncbi:hypothetical protein KAU30_03180 [Candidatus Bathyarchaeota archaeon]|nr:hypothetical protein [Candidatus Bathyarchaeota archaeon]
MGNITMIRQHHTRLIIPLANIEEEERFRFDRRAIKKLIDAIAVLPNMEI